MPETMSLERRKILMALGAHVILALDGALGMGASIERAEQMVASDPGRWVLLQQFQNPANPEIHFKTTGPEIWQDTDGKVDVLVAGIGTGGTITGISRYFKLEKRAPLISIGVEPESSAVITQTLAGQPVRPGPTGIQVDRRRIYSGHAGSEDGGSNRASRRRRIGGDGPASLRGKKGSSRASLCGAAVAVQPFGSPRNPK